MGVQCVYHLKHVWTCLCHTKNMHTNVAKGTFAFVYVHILIYSTHMGLLAVSLILWYCDIVFFVHSTWWWSQFLYDQHLLGLLWLNWRTWGFPSSSNPLIHCFTMMSPKGWNRPTDLQFWPLPIPQFQVNISHRLHPFEASWRSRFFSHLSRHLSRVFTILGVLCHISTSVFLSNVSVFFTGAFQWCRCGGGERLRVGLYQGGDHPVIWCP